jgi:hypothetical protein
MTNSKTLLAFMSGVVVTTLATVFAGGNQIWLIALGVLLAVLGLVAIGRIYGIPRIAVWLLALQNANEAIFLERGKRPSVVGALQGIRRPTAAGRRSRDGYSKPGPRVVESPKAKPVLSTIQQDVLSALVNLQMPFRQAEQAVIEAHKPGDSFEDLLRRALPAKRTA